MGAMKQGIRNSISLTSFPRYADIFSRIFCSPGFTGNWEVFFEIINVSWWSGKTITWNWASEFRKRSSQIQNIVKRPSQKYSGKI